MYCSLKCHITKSEFLLVTYNFLGAILSKKTAAKPSGIYCSNILPVLVITIYLWNVATHRPCVNDGWAADRSRGWSCKVANV